MTTGQTVRNPTIAIRAGVRAVLAFSHRASPVQFRRMEQWRGSNWRAISSPSRTARRRLDPEDQQGLPDPDLPLVGVADEDQGFDLAPEDVAPAGLVSPRAPG